MSMGSQIIVLIILMTLLPLGIIVYSAIQQPSARKELIFGAGLLLAVMFVLLVISIRYCKRAILDKIFVLLDATQKFANGDLTVRVPDHLAARELGELGFAFNDMAARVQQASEAQRESEQKYRELVENAGSIILKLDHDGTITYFNAYAEHFFGFSATEILGQNVLDTIVPEVESTGRNLTELVHRVCAHPDAYAHTINENICKNGERVWVSWNNHSLAQADGSPAGILSVGQDITRQKRTEKELQRSEQRFRSYVENVNDTIFALTPTGIFSYASPNWKETFGYDLEETIGRSFIPFIHSDDVPNCLEFLKRVFETGEKQSGVEYRILHKNGRWIWNKANGSLIRDIDTGDAIFIGIGRDISELKKAEETIRQSEEKFSAAFRASPDAITLSRLSDGRYLELNKGFTSLTGYLPKEVIGKTSQEIEIWNDPQDRLQFLQDLNKYGIVKDKEFKLKHKDGSLRTGQISARIIEINSEQCMLGITRDITEREYLQNELIKAQKLESISILAGGIAHNFNNVLTGVIGYISYAKKHLEDTNKVLQTLEAAEKSSYRAAGLARQLLTFSQGDIPIRKPVSVDALVDESVLLFLSGSNVKGSISRTSPQMVNGDSQQLNQAFNNIVLNAIQAMPNGGSLEVRIDSALLDDDNRYALQPGRYVKIVFEDSGSGIKQDDLNKIYDPYFTTKDSGTGLGLSTTHSIISKHGGCIDITSEVGKGTIVTVLLPSYSDQEGGNERRKAVAKITRDSNSILVMDHEEIIREGVAKMLNARGYKVTTCANGEETCTRYTEAMAAGKTFALAILELSIPDGMGGKEAALRILDLDPQACLIASSSYVNSQELAEYDQFGFCGSINKPYRSSELARSITRALQNRPR